MKCPRCGAEMSGGICNNCGFPTNRVQRATSFVCGNSNCFIYIFTHIDRYKNGKGGTERSETFGPPPFSLQ